MMQINLKEIKESFIATSRDLLRRAETLLLDMEKRGDAALYAELLRAIHTIKGNSGIFELKSVIQLCHAFETRLEALKNDEQKLPPELIDTCLTALDRMQLLIAHMDEPEKQTAIDFRPVLALLEADTATPDAHRDTTAPDNTAAEWVKNKAKKIRLPQKYVELARREQRFLALVVLNLADQGDLSLEQFYQKLKTLHKTRSLLSLGFLPTRAQFAGHGSAFLPYFLALNSAEQAENIMAKLGLKFMLCHHFWQPEAKTTLENLTETAANAQKDMNSEIHARETHLKVHLDLLNDLIDITGEIVLTRNAILRKIDEVHEESLSAFAKKLNQLVTSLQDKVMKTRLQSLGILFHRFPRLVRETAAQTGKKAEFIAEGGEIEIDKAIIDEIADPLVHIIRNAIDHGLESPADRVRLKKTETGCIRLTAEMREGNIVIKVSDDGRGLDLEQIRNTALSKGLVQRENAAAATPQDIAEYLFLPGFSTKNEVTTISGRGVGMDVVRTNISRLGGSVDITGDTGKGSLVTMVIPQTLSIITCLVVQVLGFRLVIPRQNIAEVVTIEPDRLKNIQNKQAYELRSHLLPLIATGDLLETGEESATDRYIVVVRTEKYHYGMKVQRVLDTEEVVVKTLPQFGQEKQIFSGAAIMGDGKIALIMDVTLIPKQVNLQSNAVIAGATLATGQLKEAAVQYLLFRAHDKKIAFKVTSLPRIETVDPRDIETIVNRQVVHYRNEVIPILATDFLRSGNRSTKEACNLIILQAEGRKYGLLATEILDIIDGHLELRREPHDLKAIDGYSIIGGETAIVLNLAELVSAADHKTEYLLQEAV